MNCSREVRASVWTCIFPKQHQLQEKLPRARARTAACPLWWCGFHEKHPALTRARRRRDVRTKLQRGFVPHKRETDPEPALPQRSGPRPRSDRRTDAFYAHLFLEYPDEGWFGHDKYREYNQRQAAFRYYNLLFYPGPTCTRVKNRNNVWRHRIMTYMTTWNAAVLQYILKYWFVAIQAQWNNKNYVHGFPV